MDLNLPDTIQLVVIPTLIYIGIGIAAFLLGRLVEKWIHKPTTQHREVRQENNRKETHGNQQ